MDTQFRSLFKGQTLSVRVFNQKLANLRAEEVNRYYAYVYTLGLTKWEEQTKTFQHFLKRLIHHDRQRFLDFTRNNVLGELGYSFADPVLAARVLALMERDEQQRSSADHLGFSFLMGFNSSTQVETLGKRIRPRTFTPEELLDINGKAIIDTGEKR